MVTAQDFSNKWNNKSVEVEDPIALDQCMDLAFQYCDELGIPREAIRHQYASQIWTNPNDTTRKYFDLIANTPKNQPSPGDIAVFKIINGIPVGHVAMVMPGTNLNNLVSFDQNWDTLHYYHLDNKGNHIPYCRTVVHNNYYGVVGWLHPKTAINPQNDEQKALQVLKNFIISSTDASGKSFTTLEGYANTLAQDAYKAWKR